MRTSDSLRHDSPPRPGSLCRRGLTCLAGGALLSLAVAAPLRAQLIADGGHVVTQSSLGGLTEAGDRYGGTLASGDFDRDGYLDLAIGAPGEAVGAVAEAGAVFIVYGTANGLGAAGARSPVILHQDVPNVDDTAEAGDRFGAALAVGDFNGDGTTDLAVGVPGEDLTVSSLTYPDSGAFHVFISTSGAEINPGVSSYWHHNRFDSATLGIADDEELGAAFAVCDRNLDGRSDLIVGLPAADHPGKLDAGVVLTVYGSSTGLTATGATLWSSSTATAGERAGSALACGSFPSGLPKMIVGAPGVGDGKAYIPADGKTILGAAGSESAFGTAVALGDFRNEKANRLIVGAPRRDILAAEEAGNASEWRGGSTYGLGGTLLQGDDGMGEVREPFDHFGEVLAFGDFDRDGTADAVFGVPGENLDDGGGSPKLDAGVVQIVYGDGDPAQWRHQLLSFEFVGFGPLSNDKFGGALATGDFDGDQVADLAIGAPGAQWEGQSGAGVVAIVYGQRRDVFADDFETGSTVRWSSTVPPS